MTCVHLLSPAVGAALSHSAEPFCLTCLTFAKVQGCICAQVSSTTLTVINCYSNTKTMSVFHREGEELSGQFSLFSFVRKK